MTTNVNIGHERLRTLAEYLKTVPEDQFSLPGWVYFHKLPTELRLKLESSIFPEDVWEEVQDCGFAGCAVGWATRIPEFRAAGLKMGYSAPEFNGSKNWSAVEKFFGINFETAEHLFSSYHYSFDKAGPLDVSNRINNWLEIHNS